MKKVLLVFVLIFSVSYAWSQMSGSLYLAPGSKSFMSIGDLDISGNQVTVEAVINRTSPWTGGRLYAGDIVSKHLSATDANYLLRPNSAEITTSNGYYITPPICDIELNKTYHVAMVYDGATLKFYRNGFLMSQVAASGNLFQNNLTASIGMYAGTLYNEFFEGYIDEVRIWKIARTRAQIKAYMNSSLPNPGSQVGLEAYYTFEDLQNKQGNAVWNGTLMSGALANANNPANTFVVDSCKIIPAAVPSIGFTAPDTVCVNTPFNVVNTSTGASNYYWSFCVADLNTAPTGTNLGNIGGRLSLPVFMDYVFANGNYYGFVTNHSPGGLTRLDFGNSLLNTPTATSLGSFGGLLPSGYGTECIQVVNNEGKWYALIVGGNPAQGTVPRIIKIEFGANISNPAPVATDWGNIGNLLQPIDLHVFKENNNWYGLTVNAENNTITRFSFTNSFDNIPTGQNLGNIGGLNYPTGIYAIDDNGNWKVFVLNGGTSQATGVGSSLTRLDFGSSLLNTPTGTNLGNLGGKLQHPRDFTIMKSCGQIVGFAVNGRIGYNDIVKLNFNNNLSATPVAVSLGNIGSLSFPHSISKLFRVDNDLYSFVTNVNNNTITRLKFTGCTSSSIPNSTLQNPPAIVYNTPGTYSINLTIDEGLPTQTSACKQVVVLPTTIAKDVSYKQDICNPLQVQFFNSDNLMNIGWDFGDGSARVNQQNPLHTFPLPGSYTIKMWSVAGKCGIVDTISRTIVLKIDSVNAILNADTSVCNGLVKMRTMPGVEFCWTPSTYLDNPNIANPVSTPLTDITYRLTAKTVGVNLVVNGDFNAGNTGFTSEFAFVANNTTDGEYTVGNIPKAWNAALSSCTDHSGGTGNMLMAHGIPQDNKVVWKQAITIVPNTDYEFSTWIQALSTLNATALQFSINGVNLGNPIAVGSSACTWTRFHTIWNSGNNNTAVISIVNKNTLVQGNDFALDDISFAPFSFNTDSVRITIDRPIVKALKDTAICTGATLQLNATGAASYKWAPTAGLSNPNIVNPVALPTASARYIVTGTSALGCTASDTVDIGLLTLPAIQMTGDTSICSNSALQLNASGGVIYQWSPAAAFSNAGIANPTVTPTANSMYTLKATGSNGCIAEDSVMVSIRPAAQFGLQDANPKGCVGQAVQLSAYGGAEYLWTPSIGLNDPAVANPVARLTGNQTYQVQIKEPVCNEQAIFTVPVTIGKLDQITVSSSNDLTCNIPTSQLNASGGISYSWQPVAGLSNPNIANPVASPSQSTKYIVTVSGSDGCSAKDSVDVKVDATGNFKLFQMPNAFTPNNDGKNDCFGLSKWGNVQVAFFDVYNRWGQKVFSASSANSCWDGKLQGVMQPAGNYVYRLKVLTLCGVVERNGSVVLVR
ncbi:MAG TPA: LamG-like jellyroll fold domain-containing protein [Phnomibacter sp.]|nr:LamG-like jellyroll fold domain-containing protein [Phnomibacter sp.]